MSGGKKAARNAAELGALAEELANRWQQLLTDLAGAKGAVPPPWVEGEADPEDGGYMGPVYTLSNGLVLMTAWSPKRGAHAWVDDAAATQHMDLDVTLELLARVTDVAKLMADAERTR